MTTTEGVHMRREDAWDALEQAQNLNERVRPMGGWYAFYGIAYGMVSLGLVLSLGITNSAVGSLVASVVAVTIICLLSVYSARQPVKPLGYGPLHAWGIAAWGVIYGVALFVGMYVFPGDLLWWAPMAVLSALPTTVTGLIALRRSRNTK
ncbi:hypothetical protein ACWGSK_19930 [Nocardiopsis sp. NPDC055551]|uniref:hypothetical protein n=1 Tax=Nocardiopsis sp. NPDC006832 TaxID=3157188 RepID=UPI0033D9BAE3